MNVVKLNSHRQSPLSATCKPVDPWKFSAHLRVSLGGTCEKRDANWLTELAHLRQDHAITIG